MSRRDNRAHRCGLCLMHAGLCVCPLVPRIETTTRLVLVIHHSELRKPTNTGHLAATSLVNSEVHVRGRENVPNTPIEWGDRTPLLLFPHEGAEPIAKASGPVALIVPDGNWRQAWKMRARVPGLRAARCVTLPPGPPTIYRLRTETHPEGLATMEAIARAMGILEGRQVQDALEHVFRAMVERTLWARGVIATKDVTGGIPEGATRHDPRSALKHAASVADGATAADHALTKSTRAILSPRSV